MREDIKSKNISIQDLAKKIKVNFSTLYLNFNGKTEMSLATYLKIQKLLKNEINNRTESGDNA